MLQTSNLAFLPIFFLFFPFLVFTKSRVLNLLRHPNCHCYWKLIKILQIYLHHKSPPEDTESIPSPLDKIEWTWLWRVWVEIFSQLCCGQYCLEIPVEFSSRCLNCIECTVCIMKYIKSHNNNNNNNNNNNTLIPVRLYRKRLWARSLYLFSSFRKRGVIQVRSFGVWQNYLSS